MGKMKASIFTVAESMTNWFEASSHSPADIEISAGGPNQVSLGEGLEEQLQLVGLADKGTDTGRPTPVLLQPVGETNGHPTADQPGRTAGNVAVGPSRGEVKVTGPPATTELADYEEGVRQAFWELLKTAGYEVW